MFKGGEELSPINVFLSTPLLVVKTTLENELCRSLGGIIFVMIIIDISSTRLRRKNLMITKFPNTISSEEFFLRYFFFSITSCTIMNVTIIHIYVFPRCVYVCVCVCVCVCVLYNHSSFLWVLVLYSPHWPHNCLSVQLQWRNIVLTITSEYICRARFLVRIARLFVT